MGLETIEHVRNLLALVGSKSGYVDQRLDTFGTRESDDRTRIGVPRQARSALRVRSKLRLRAATSSPRGERKRRRQTFTDCALSAVMTRAQLDPSAHAPWASTTLTSWVTILLLLKIAWDAAAHNQHITA